ncbi:MAG: ferritin-like domain-containing protein [Solirubrobacteraceae bacterium]
MRLSNAGFHRRELLSCGIRAGGLALAGVGLGSLRNAEDAAARTEQLVAGTQDVAAGTEVGTGAEALAALLEVERLAELAYRQVLRAGVLRAGAQQTARALLAHEQAHVGILDAWSRTLGGASVRSSIDEPAATKALAAHHVTGSLTKLGGERDALRLLIGIEAAVERAYSRAIARLGDPVHVRVSLEMMACDAQHATVLSELLHPGDVSRAVPGPLVPGTR